MYVVEHVGLEHVTHKSTRRPVDWLLLLMWDLTFYFSGSSLKRRFSCRHTATIAARPSTNLLEPNKCPSKGCYVLRQSPP